MTEREVVKLAVEINMGKKKYSDLTVEELKALLESGSIQGRKWKALIAELSNRGIKADYSKMTKSYTYTEVPVFTKEETERHYLDELSSGSLTLTEVEYRLNWLKRYKSSYKKSTMSVRLA